MQAGEPSSAKLSVLCVEDGSTSREPLHLCITSRFGDLAVHWAASGAEGMRLYREHLPQIVVIDIGTPTLEGVALAAGIRHLDPEVVLVGIADISDPDCLRRTADIRLSRYLLKPVHPVDLLAELEREIAAVTLRRQAAFQQVQVRMLAMAVEQNPCSVLITAADGTIEYVNPVFTTISGYAREEVLGQNPRLLKSGLTPPETYAELWHTITCGGVWQGELQNRRKCGDFYWVSMVVSPLYDDGRAVHYVAVRENITDRKLAEKEHQSTLEFLALVNRCSSVRGVMTVSLKYFRQKSGCRAVGIRLREGEEYPYYAVQGLPAGFTEEESLLCNRDAEGELIRDAGGNPIIEGRCGDVIRGRIDPSKPYFTGHGSFWTNSNSRLLQEEAGGGPGTCQRKRCASEGFESVALIPLNMGKEHLGLLQLNDPRQGLFTRRDIEQWEQLVDHLAVVLLRLRAEESLNQLNADLEQRIVERTHLLETALREQESFSYSVSHDLRAPLRHINSYLAILADDYGELLPAEALSVLERSRSASARMSHLIDGILELSRVSRSSLNRENVSLTALAKNVCNLLRETEPERTVEFVIKEGLNARGDKLLLQQMIMNLLGNAWKYSSTLEKARIEFGSCFISGQKTFYVKDNGVGFDMAYSNKLFGEFQRLHGPEYEGTGIGLATVKRIVDRHRGKIWAESKSGEGATFYFVLP